MLRSELSPENLPIVRGVLQQSDPSLGVPPGKQSRICKLLKLNRDDELATRDGQLLRLIREQQEQISAEIQGHLSALEIRAQQALLARAQVEFAQQTFENLLELQRLGRGMPLETSQAELRLLELQQTRMARFLAWKRAQVELAAAQGVLAMECGYDVHAVGCCCP